jgi:hypothetical protein
MGQQGVLHMMQLQGGLSWINSVSKHEQTHGRELLMSTCAWADADVAAAAEQP